MVICRDRKLHLFAFFTFVQKIAIENARNRNQISFKVGAHERSLKINELLVEIVVYQKALSVEMCERGFGLGLNLDLIC